MSEGPFIHVSQKQVRADHILHILCAELLPLFSAVVKAPADPLVASDIITVSEFTSAVLPHVSDSSLPALASITSALLDFLRPVCTPPSAPGEVAARSHSHIAAEWAEATLLRLLVELCVWMSSLLERAAATWVVAEREAVERALTDSLSAVCLNATSLIVFSEASAVVRTAAVALGAVARRRWPSCVHEAPGLQQLRGLKVSSFGRLGPEQRHALIVAIGCALLLPAKDAKMELYPEQLLPHWRREACMQLVEDLCREWDGVCDEGGFMWTTTGDKMKGACDLVDAMAGEHRAVKVSCNQGLF